MSLSFCGRAWRCILQDNRSVVLAYVDAFNRGDLDSLCDLFAPNALIWGVLGFGGMDVVRPAWKDLMECLQIHLQVDALICERDRASVRLTERGKSAKAFRGNGPTGLSYEVMAMEWFEIQNGLIHRRWGARDSASVWRQLQFPPQ